jgi:hypothetical protein
MEKEVEKLENRAKQLQDKIDKSRDTFISYGYIKELEEINEELIQKKVEIHKQRIKQLSKLEIELIEMISKTGNDELMNKFLDWQNQRTFCNSAYLDTLKVMSE